MSRTSTIVKRLATGLALLGFGWAASTGVAAAQCATSCNPATHHWNLSPTTSADDWRIGMVKVNGKYHPARCNVVNPASPNQLAIDYNYTYDMPQLTENASVCMSAGADKWKFIESTMTCLSINIPVTIYPFDLNGKRMVISGETGNDTLEIGIGVGAAGTVGQYALCGGADNDRLIGGYDVQYLYGQAGHDWMWGGRQNDEVRGGSGQDVIQHPSQEGTDLVLGEGDIDCMFVNGPVQATSSCTWEWFVVNYYQSNGTSIDACTDPIANCCSVSPAC